MILRFADNTSIVVRDIYGGPRLVKGVMRDALTIYLDNPNVISVDTIRNMFKDQKKTIELHVEEDDGTKSEVGVGYTIFVSFAEESIRINHTPGQIMKDTFVDVFTVIIAQQTYEEYTSRDQSADKEG